MATTNPTITSLTTVDPSYAPHLTSALASATHALATATADGDLYQYSKSVAIASNSLAVISAQSVLATATGLDYLLASDVIMAAATEIAKIEYLDNMYRADLNMGANVFFCVIFGVLTIWHFVVGGLYRYWYFFFVLGIGSGLDFGGYLARSVSATDETLVNPFWSRLSCLPLPLRSSWRVSITCLADSWCTLARATLGLNPGGSRTSMSPATSSPLSFRPSVVVWLPLRCLLTRIPMLAPM